MRVSKRKKILLLIIAVALATLICQAGRLYSPLWDVWLPLLTRTYNVSMVFAAPLGKIAAVNSATSPQPWCSELSAGFPDSIPPLVHWTSRDGRVPAKLLPIVLTWRRLLNDSSTTAAAAAALAALNISEDNASSALMYGGGSTANWQFMHWDDEQIAELVAKHYPLLNRSYVKLVNGLERSDIGRLVVLHHVGGMYVDTDVELLRDPAPLLQPSRFLLGDKDINRGNCCTAIWTQEPLEHALFIYDMPKLISNAVILSRANHSFLSYVLTEWPAWFEANWANKKSREHIEAARVTGPLMLQQFFDKYTALKPNQRPSDWSGTLLTEPDLFQPRFDEPNLISRMKKACAIPAKLNELKKRQCQRLIKLNYKNQALLPERAFTVHGFKHLSYTHKMDFTNSKKISSLLPILKCRV